MLVLCAARLPGAPATVGVSKDKAERSVHVLKPLLGQAETRVGQVVKRLACDGQPNQPGPVNLGSSFVRGEGRPLRISTKNCLQSRLRI